MQDARLIDQELVSAAVDRLGCDWIYRQQTESTNVDVLDYFQHQQREVVACCESQTAGRGRRGRQWNSPFAQNIYCTVGITHSLPPHRLGMLSIVCGIALLDAIAAIGVSGVKLKWPNDLLYDFRKLGGILIESQPVSGDEYFFAIGFGLNVDMSESELESIGQPAISLRQIARQPVSRSELLARAIESVVTAIRGFDDAAAEQLSRQFEQYDAYHNASVEVISAQQTIVGINRGLDASGQLRLETADGETVFSAAEISLRALR